MHNEELPDIIIDIQGWDYLPPCIFFGSHGTIIETGPFILNTWSLTNYANRFEGANVVNAAIMRWQVY